MGSAQMEGIAMRPALLLAAMFGFGPPGPATPPGERESKPTNSVIVVVGAAGTPEYGKQFSEWADHWKSAAKKGEAEFTAIGLTPTKSGMTDRDQLARLLKAEKSVDNNSALWIVLIGHGTFDSRSAKFNLRGPDVTASDLQSWLSDSVRPTAIINCASASGPFLNKLAAPNRVVITATKSGYEQNFARFGKYISEAIANPEADLDKDEQTSLLEAYLLASRRTKEFYTTDGRLETEHALMDDNGDGKGTRADWFRGVRPTRKPAGGDEVDGYRAHQLHLVRSDRERRLSAEVRRRRDDLELSVIRLRDRKAEMEDTAYYTQLETLLIQIAELYEQSEKPAADVAATVKD